MGILDEYLRQQQNQQGFYNNYFNNLQGYLNQGNTNVQQINNQNLSNLLSGLSGVMSRPTQTVSYNPNMPIQQLHSLLAQQDEQGSRSQAEAYGGLDALAKYFPEEAAAHRANLDKYYQSLAQSRQGLHGYFQGGSSLYGQPINTAMANVPQTSQEYSNFLSNFTNQAAGIGGEYANIASRGTEWRNRANQRESELKAQRLQERQQYFANQANRQQGMLASRAERRGAGAIARRREALSRSGNPGYLSSMTLTR